MLYLAFTPYCTMSHWIIGCEIKGLTLLQIRYVDNDVVKAVVQKEPKSLQESVRSQVSTIDKILNHSWMSGPID